MMQIIFFFLIRQSTYLQLLCRWLSFLILLHMLKPNLKVLQEKTTAPHGIISRYQRSLPTLLGIHQPLLGRSALQKSSPVLFVTKCTMLHFVRKKNGCKGIQRKITVIFPTCCKGNDTTSVSLPYDCS